MIVAEIEANNVKVRELAGEEGAKVGQNVAAGVAGVFIPVLWFGMDFKGAASKEVTALQARQQYLTTLATERCAKPNSRLDFALSAQDHEIVGVGYDPRAEAVLQPEHLPSQHEPAHVETITRTRFCPRALRQDFENHTIEGNRHVSKPQRFYQVVGGRYLADRFDGIDNIGPCDAHDWHLPQHAAGHSRLELLYSRPWLVQQLDTQPSQ
jgi:hypothetical protein